MIWVLVFHVKESNYFTEENVIAPHHVEEEATIIGRITREQLEAELRKEKVARGEVSSEAASVPKSGSVKVNEVSSA